MTFNFNAPVGQVIAGDQTVHGDNIGTQNNYHGDVPNPEKLAAELDELLNRISQKVSDPATEEGKKIVIASAIKEVNDNPSFKDRLVAFFTAGTFEAIKQFSKNPYVEVFLAAFKAGLETKPKK